MIRLLSEEQVLDIICKYEDGSKQKTMVYEISKLVGVLATEEQFLTIKGEEDLNLE